MVVLSDTKAGLMILPCPIRASSSSSPLSFYLNDSDYYYFFFFLFRTILPWYCLHSRTESDPVCNDQVPKEKQP